MIKKIAILSTGDEIICGDILDTNTQYIAHELFSNNLTPGKLLSCNDNEKEIIDCIQFLLVNHDVLIITGGLGPTSDDITRFALARCIKKKLIFYEESWQYIKNRLGNIGVALSQSSKQQCLFPAKSNLLKNPNGTAMGCMIKYKEKLIFMLPGPPNECLPMFKDYVLNTLKNSCAIKKTILLKWRIFGLSEGQISEQLDKSLSHLKCKIGYRWDYPYIEFKVTCDKKIKQLVKDIINPILNKYIISPADKSASESLTEYIKKINKTVNIIDLATGGLLEASIYKPCIFSKLSFGGDINSDIKVLISGLDEFWQQQNSNRTSTTLTINYNGKESVEKIEYPYKNSLIQKRVVEYLAYRIKAIIKEKLTK